VASRVETGAKNIDLVSHRDDELSKINLQTNVNFSEIKNRNEMAVGCSVENPVNTSLVEDDFNNTGRDRSES